MTTTAHTPRRRPSRRRFDEGLGPVSRARAARASCPHPYVYASAWRPCVRRMVYELTLPDRQAPFSPDVLARFRRGEDRERDLLMDLARVGREAEPSFQVIGQQQRFELKDRKGRVAIAGKVDARLRQGDRAIPLEVKAWSPTLVERIRTFEDLFENPWTRGGALPDLELPVGRRRAARVPAARPLGPAARAAGGARGASRSDGGLPHPRRARARPRRRRHAARLPGRRRRRVPALPVLRRPLQPAARLRRAPGADRPRARGAARATRGGARGRPGIRPPGQAGQGRLRGVENAVAGHFTINGKWGKQSRSSSPRP